MIVRKLLSSFGCRYRIHRKDIPDIAFIGRRKVILVHDCFWHRHPGCKYAHIPKSNLDKWLVKFKANTERDMRTAEQLRQSGWQTLVVWECETKDLDNLAEKLAKFLD